MPSHMIRVASVLIFFVLQTFRSSASLFSEFEQVTQDLNKSIKRINELYAKHTKLLSAINSDVHRWRMSHYGENALENYAYITLVTGDNGYAMGALALGASLHQAGSVARRFCIVTPSTSSESLKLIVASGLWEIVHTKDLRCSKKHDIRCNKLSLFDGRLDMIQSLKRYIFIDADAYVKENLDHLFWKFDNNPLVGARNCPLHKLSNGTVVDACNPNLPKNVIKEIIDEAISLDPTNFNSGLMLIDPKLVGPYAILSYTGAWNSSWEGDQDPLNEIFADCPMLPPAYNTLMCCQDLPELQRRARAAKMVHFSLKKMKPWDIYRVDMEIKGGDFDIEDTYPISRWWEVSHPFHEVYVEWTGYLQYALTNSLHSVRFEL